MGKENEAAEGKPELALRQDSVQIEFIALGIAPFPFGPEGQRDEYRNLTHL